jgi:tryptophan 2,3-dioxygenase
MNNSVEISEYEQYMGTPTLLSLQRDPAIALHRDELLFQVVHQVSELWLKTATADLLEALAKLMDHDYQPAVLLVQRAHMAAQQVTQSLAALYLMSPGDFRQLRPSLGGGSGADSPGWRGLRGVTKSLDLVAHHIFPVASPEPAGRGMGPAISCLTALVVLDEEVSRWRSRHLQLAERMLARGERGTQGMPIPELRHLAEQRLLPHCRGIAKNIGLGGDAGRSLEVVG